MRAGQERQRPYVPEQMRDSGLPAGQPPYPRPSAQTSVPPTPTPTPTRGSAGTVTDGTPVTRRGVRDPGRSARSRGREAPVGPVRGASGGTATAGGAGEGGRAAGRLGSGTASNTSRAGDCTICGATSWAGPVTSGRGEGRGRGSTDTQPERAVTVSPTRRFAVILVLCTRTTLRCGPVFGDPVGGEWPARVTRSARRPVCARRRSCEPQRPMIMAWPGGSRTDRQEGAGRRRRMLPGRAQRRTAAHSGVQRHGDRETS